MSRQSVKTVIGRAVFDREFRSLLLNSPDLALADYDLTEEEIVVLVGVDAESMHTFFDDLEEVVLRSREASPHMNQLFNLVGE